jgi:alpha-N-arabinofuranosidase
MASGPSDADYHWTDVMMREAGGKIDGIGLHYYTISNTWQHKGSATDFDENAWAKTLAATLKMDEYITKHSEIMDKYDPKKRVWLGVDEWGTWYDVEPGTNPGFLYQQNSLRDALVAAINFNIFVKHADRVKMANIAQMVNVLQAMILTRDEKMLLTPTYYAFELYKAYQDATSLPIELKSPWYSREGVSIPAISASAVRDAAGKVHIGLVNLDPNNAVAVMAKIAGMPSGAVSGRVITAPAMNSVNTFEQPRVVTSVPFGDARMEGDVLKVTLPAKSVVMLDGQ